MAIRKSGSAPSIDPIALVLITCFEDPAFFERLLKNVKGALKKENITLSDTDIALITSEIAGLGDEGISTMRFMLAVTKISKNTLTSIVIKRPVPPWSNPATLKRWLDRLRNPIGPKPGPTP